MFRGSIALLETSVKAAVAQGTALDQRVDPIISVGGVSGDSSSYPLALAHSAERTTVATVSSDVKEEVDQTLQQILHDHSIVVLPSVSDADPRLPPLSPDPNSMTSTTVGRTPIRGTRAPGFVRKPHSSSRAMTQRILQEPDPKVEHTLISSFLKQGVIVCS